MRYRCALERVVLCAIASLLERVSFYLRIIFSENRFPLFRMMR